MERLFYSPTQFATELKEANPSIEEIDYFINYNSIKEAKEFNNYNVRPIVIKVIGKDFNREEDKDIRLNISRQIFSRMQLYHESDPDGKYLCLRTDTKEEKTYNAIDGDHQYYSTRVLLVPYDSPLNQSLEEIEQKQVYKRITIEEIENNYTL